MKEGGHVLLYIYDLRTLVSRIEDWGERDLIHHFRKGLASRILDKLSSYPSRIDSLQDLMEITLELDTRYHERQKENNNFKEKKPETSKSVSSHPQNSSSSNQKKNFHFQKMEKLHSSFLNGEFKLMGSEKERRFKEGFILIDSGSTNSLIANQFVQKFSLTISGIPEKIPLIILESSESPSLFVTHHTKFIVELSSLPTFEWDFLVIYTPKGEGLILGFEITNNLNKSIHLRKGLITFNSYPSNSSSNDLSFAKSCVALIQDAGEDNSESSLHIFLGNVDLPLSFDHDSLEELWDEEEEPEEIETVMKVLPPAYHHYLDVFSKVKAEKLPPHGTCDHHIELEGSLTMAGLIYSLSNQESDTLRA
ncbi:hypothetical protein O181_005289 [Austropuccinia psidii MF-1]|uniref:Uncharacterized protein n=1 Tax=Austropuccinia psidii MF-1 TaxID=1389203 RepID=A0A9Q3BHT9_9BASI|nr:hypothetical protein [Austropuccinia psidii MF-1]